ncbi:MAG: hypothetical protein RL299_1303, partial [Pseudomonadota bacterium]
MRKVLKLGVAVIALGAAWWGWKSNPVQDAVTTALAKSDADVPLAPHPQRVYWGDTHLHTANSPDAFGFGTRLDPEAALRFARGEEVTATTGAKAKLARPLDFLVIADHSDGLGFSKMLADAPRFLLPDDRLKRWHDMFNESPEASAKATAEMIDLGRDMKNADKIADPKKTAEQVESIWRGSIRTVERFNDPGTFSAFIGFEFTSMPNGNNLHRVVMLRDGFKLGRQVTPAVAKTSSEPEALWDWMDNYEKLTGGKALAIPHNSNMSGGLMFEANLPSGGPMTTAYARRRAMREPIVEATQIKGDSESHPLLS